MRPFLTEVCHNLCQGAPEPTTFKLGFHTFILGPEGSGKTALLNAVELLLTGKVDDRRGKADDQVAAIGHLGLLGVPGRDMLVTGKFSTGQTTSWRAPWNGTAWGKAEWNYPQVIVDPRRALPIRNVRAVVSGDPADAMSFFMGAGGSDSAALEALDKDNYVIASEIMQGPDFRTGSAPLLDTLIDLASKQKRAAEAVARENEKLSESDAPEVTTEADVAVAAARDSAGSGLPLDVLGQWTAEYIAWRVVELNASADFMAKHRAELEAQQLELEQQRANVLGVSPDQERDLIRMIGGIEQVNTVLRDLMDQWPDLQDGAYCLMCGADHPEGTMQERAAKLDTNKQALETELRELRKTVQTRRLETQEIDAKLATIKASLASLADADTLYTTLWAELDVRGIADTVSFPETAGTPQPARFPVVDETESGITLTEMLKRRDAYVKWSEAGGTAKRCRKRAAELGDFIKKCETVKVSFASRGAAAYTSRVSKYLNPGESLEVLTSWGGQSGFYPTLVRDDVKRPELSGGQRQRMLFALASTVLPPENMAAALIPADRSMNASTLGWWLGRLQDIDAQVLLASTTLPNFGDAADHWRMITLSAR